MNTSQTTSNSNDDDIERISRGELAYVTARNQHAAHNLLLRAIKDSGLSQKQLAKKTGMDEATVSRLLRRPSNFQINTYSRLLYGACGAYLSVAPAFPEKATASMIMFSPVEYASTDAGKTIWYSVTDASEPVFTSAATAANDWYKEKNTGGIVFKERLNA